MNAKRGQPGRDDGDAGSLIRELDRLTGCNCADCLHALCGHDVLCSVALGFKDLPRCADCFARGLELPIDQLLDKLRQYVRDRDCYRKAWQVATQRERPKCCRWVTADVSAGLSEPTNAAPPIGTPIALCDAGEMACGDLVLLLRRRLEPMPSGSVLQVIAHDRAAPEDLPAWCRLTGHRLVRSEHPEYLIQRKGV